MLFTVITKLNDEKCQLCLQGKEVVVKVRFGDGFRVKCCTACMWKRSDAMGVKDADSK